MLEINKDIEKYILEHTSLEDELLRELTRITHLKVLQPRMLSGKIQGCILQMFSKMISPKYILEIGTFTGYSAICLAQGLTDEGVLHTIDINDETLEIAREYISRSNVVGKIIIHEGNALTIIPQLNILFDFVFIDGDKREYLEYYHTVFDKVAPGGFIFADNVLWDGKIVKEIKHNDRYTKGIVEFNDFVVTDVRVECILLPFRDGIMAIRKK
ncbi:MAG: O-methyltransferase [Prevotellaceae bacterium]|jgi:predicted O-methyltransferase YrrM|nr:O-methyltransferase [Prevotellaceae bacterium]